MIFALETFDDDTNHGVQAVFSSKEAAIEGAIKMVRQGWQDFENVFFLICTMTLDNWNHTFDPTNTYRFAVVDGEVFDVEYDSWDGWHIKVGDNV